MTEPDPRDLPRRCDVVIVGAGLAGLAAAHHLAGRDLEVVVVEAADDVGGRVRTDVVDGFRLDRGFQLYNPAYPEGRRVLDHDALDLQPFIAGARITLGSGHYRVADPRRQPTWAWDTMTAPIGSLLAESRFAAYALSRSLRTPASLRQEPDVTTAQALQTAGVDEQFMERLLRPFLSGVFLESSLSTSRRFADLVLRSFIRGTPSVPAEGMGAIPRDLAGRAGAQIHLGTTVTEVTATGVRTSRGRIASRAVIIATDPRSAGQLAPGVDIPDARSVTTWYFRPDVPGASLTDGVGVLTLEGNGDPGGHRPLVNAVVLTNTAPGYAPPGESLVSCSALGVRTSSADAAVARAHLARLMGADTHRWDLLATYPIPYALPAMSVPLTLQRPVRLDDGVYVAGDHRDTASIQGALVSGRRAATALLADVTRTTRSSTRPTPTTASEGGP